MEIDWAVHVQPYPGAPRGGDAGIVVPSADGALAVLIDAAGHGLAAYAVAQKARAAIFENPAAEPDDLLHILNGVLKNTTGAAISIARLRGDMLSFAGIGNVAASIGPQPLLVRFGVVGLRMHQPKLVHATLPKNTWFMMHTDGLSHPKSIPPGNAKIAATTLIETHSSGSDDAAVLLLRWREATP